MFPLEMERIVRYSRQGFQCESGDREELLSTFLYDLPFVTVCSILPPLHILNDALSRGFSGGEISPYFVWEPFEVSEQEYQEVLPKLLNPDWKLLFDKVWRIRIPMKLDPEFNHITERYVWENAVTKKHGGQAHAEEVQQFQRENLDLITEFQLNRSQPKKAPQAEQERITTSQEGNLKPFERISAFLKSFLNSLLQ